MHQKIEEQGRLFYLRTQPPPTHPQKGRGFPAVCVATKVEVSEEEGHIKVKYAISTYNLADLRTHWTYKGVELAIPFSRKTARNRARGRLDSLSHCRQLIIPSTDIPAHVKQRICEDIAANSKSAIARECAALWLQQNSEYQVTQIPEPPCVSQEVKEAVYAECEAEKKAEEPGPCEHTPSFPISIEVKPAKPVHDSLTIPPASTMIAEVEVPAVEEQEYRDSTELEALNEQAPPKSDFMDRVFGPYLVKDDEEVEGHPV